ncbi:DUF6624 domain-containing protein [Undibacterium terreum]|nr:DUF6624 domain-containing protein [Undibacterium terreum]
MCSFAACLPIYSTFAQTTSCDLRDLQPRYEKMGLSDQTIRMEFRKRDAAPDAEWRNGGREALGKQWEAIDEANQKELDTIVAACGYPRGPKTIGHGPYAAFYVIHHAELDYQLKYFAMLKESVERGETDAYSFAQFEDRVLLSQGKPQKYGFQRWPVVNGIEQKLVQDPARVNALRAAFGQPPIPGFP